MADFRPFEEFFAAPHLVDDAGVSEGLFEWSGLGVDAVEDRNFGRGYSLFNEVFDVSGDGSGFGGFVVVASEDGCWAGGEHAAELEFRAGNSAGCLTDDGVG